MLLFVLLMRLRLLILYCRFCVIGFLLVLFIWLSGLMLFC